MTNEEAIKILKEERWYMSRYSKDYKEAYDMAIEALQAQTDGDTISRRMAIKAVHDDFNECCVWDESGERTADEVESILDRVPSAQTEKPKIIMCKDCKYYKSKQGGLPWDNSRRYCNRSVTLATNPDDFCSYGKRMRNHE